MCDDECTLFDYKEDDQFHYYICTREEGEPCLDPCGLEEIRVLKEAK